MIVFQGWQYKDSLKNIWTSFPQYSYSTKIVSWYRQILIFISVIISFWRLLSWNWGLAPTRISLSVWSFGFCVFGKMSHPLRFGLPSIAAFCIAAFVLPTDCNMEGSYVMPTGHRWLLNPMSISQVITLRNMNVHEILFCSMFVTFPFSASVLFYKWDIYVCSLRRVYTHFWTGGLVLWPICQRISLGVISHLLFRKSSRPVCQCLHSHFPFKEHPRC